MMYQIDCYFTRAGGQIEAGFFTLSAGCWPNDPEENFLDRLRARAVELAPQHTKTIHVVIWRSFLRLRRPPRLERETSGRIDL